MNKINISLDEIEYNGKRYVLKDVEKTRPFSDGSEYKYMQKEFVECEEFSHLKYCIVRSLHAGVFAGYLESRNGQEVVMRNARRIWYWAGAASLSELAVEGTIKPEECNFPVAVSRVELLFVIEILDCTEKAKKSIQGVPVWTAAN